MVVIMTPRGGEWFDVAVAAAQWFWGQGLRGEPGARVRDRRKPLCVIETAVSADDVYEVATGWRVGLMLTDNAWDRRVRGCRLGGLSHAAHACVAVTCRRRADRDHPGVPPYVEFMAAPEIGLKAGMALFTSSHCPRVFGYPYPGKGSDAWADVYGSEAPPV